ncbi:hypothetical protein HK103_002467 [Boothiomyces macroporosus]|uniref:Zn(2)-C6 fungal-type domain-containing protein n=1 Tax=Boothiomyces macroporosus TaxID=261099 RepID=A0AAD5U9H9_9FUNG|nr:hypothetical protein HK103_002467 [Boothiomyces macroporosus]
MKSCEACIRKKQRCSRTTPCHNCVQKNLKCVYLSKQEVIDKYAEMEQRIKRLEMQLIIPLKYSWEERKDLAENREMVSITDDMEKILFTNNDYLIDLRFQKFPGKLNYIEEEYYRNSAKIFWPLRYALYASGSLFVAPNMVPKGLENRLEMSLAYLKKALTFNFFDKPDHFHVLALTEIGSAYFRLDRSEGIRYIKLAVQIAKSIGMNTEKGISKLSFFDYEQENIRRVWWLLFTIFTITNRVFGPDLITDFDNQVYLPSDVYFKAESISELYCMDIMSSAEWYTACVKGLSVMAYKILLHRIEARIQQYILLELSEPSINTDCIRGTLFGSLREWLDCYVPKVNYHYGLIVSNQCTDPPLSWLAIFTSLIYNNNILELVFPKFMKNVLQSKKVQNTMYYDEALKVTLNNSTLLHTIKLCNPKMEHLNLHLFKMTFKAAFFLQCVTKIPNAATAQVVAAYNLHLESLLAQGVVFQRTNSFYNILIYLKDFDLYHSVLKFGEFSARKFDVAFERPQAVLVDSLTNLNIVPEAKLYFKFGCMLAKEIGVVTEDGIEKLSPFDYERENIRGIWWNFHTLGILLDEDFDFKVEVYLPANYLFEQRSESDIYGMEIMNSDEWYTFSLPNLSFAAYRVLLKRIQGKVMRYTYLKMLGELKEESYIVGAISGSLNDWISCTQEYFVQQYRLISSNSVQYPLNTWTALYTKLSFNYLRIELIMPKLIKKILEGTSVYGILHLGAAILSALDNTYLLQLIKTHNPDFKYLIGHIGVMMFPSAFLLQCVSKFPRSKKFKVDRGLIQKAFSTHLDALSLYATAFQREMTYYQLLIQMNDLDLYNAVLTFGEIKASGNELVIQRAKPDPVELLSQLSLN